MMAIIVFTTFLLPIIRKKIADYQLRKILETTTFSEELDVLSLDVINNIKDKNSITDSLNAYKNKFDSILILISISR